MPNLIIRPSVVLPEGWDSTILIVQRTRLSELNLSYTLPRKWFNNKVGITAGIVGKNLWMIYCKAPFDPEMTPSTTSNFYQGVDYFMQPSTRNIGFNVKFQY